jgi:hypothetical protein
VPSIPKRVFVDDLSSEAGFAPLGVDAAQLAYASSCGYVGLDPYQGRPYRKFYVQSGVNA